MQYNHGKYSGKYAEADNEYEIHHYRHAKDTMIVQYDTTIMTQCIAHVYTEFVWEFESYNLIQVA